MNNTNETSRLETIASKSLYAHGVNSATIQASFRIFSRYFLPGPILELGPAEGVMTDKLVQLGQEVTVVDGSAAFCEALSLRHPQIKAVHALFEEYQPSSLAMNIVLGHVLEHVEDPVQILSRALSWLAPGGRIFAAVPNSRSLHRQAAVLMGLLPFEESLNEADFHHGHRRVYNPETFRRDLRAAGLQVEASGGYWLKPLSNSQIEQTWTPEMLNAFMELGERYPDIAGELYVIATGPSVADGEAYFTATWSSDAPEWKPQA